MKPTQTDYVISYDNFTGYLLCTIDRKVVSAESLAELLTYIAKLYDFEPKIIYSELHYAKVLENELNITIEIKD